MPDLFVAPKDNKAPLQQAGTTPVDKTTPVVQISQGMGFFTALAQMPQGISFQSQEPNETVVLLLRRHFITNVPWIFFTLLFLLLPPFFPFLLSLIAMTIPVTFFHLTFILTVFYYLLVLGYAFTSFIYWFYNIGLITQHRVVDIQFSDITYKNIATTTINEIVDATFVQSGFFQSLFNYGTVTLETQGQKHEFDFPLVPKPQKVVSIVLQLMEEQPHG